MRGSPGCGTGRGDGSELMCTPRDRSCGKAGLAPLSRRKARCTAALAPLPRRVTMIECRMQAP